MGFDFIKVDFCGGDPIHNEDRLKLDEQERYTAISQAIQNTGRTDVRFNICRWAYPGTWANQVSTSWRISGDINASWESVRNIIEENLYLSAYCIDGSYNDMDMLEVGRGLKTEEDKTHFGMWCIMDSPLLIGCSLTSLTAGNKTYKLLTNPDLIALNQDTLYLQAYVAKRDGGCYVLVKDLEKKYGLKRAVAFYNSTDEAQDISIDFADIELGGVIKMHDCFENTDVDDAETSFTVNVPAHGTRIYTLVGEQRLERTLYEAETAYMTSYQEIGGGNTGVYSSDNNCSGGMKAGWLGKGTKNDLQWRNVYSLDGGEYSMDLYYQSGESRSVTVEVNGKKVGAYSLNSGSYSKVGKKTVKITLEPGGNVVRLYNASNWMPDIDCMKLTLINKPDGISTPSALKTSSKAYTLSGHQAKAQQKGIVIKDDKKVVRK